MNQAQEAKYSISIQKIDIAFKVVEGLPVTITLEKGEEFTVQFINVQDTGSIYVMLEDLNFTDEQMNVAPNLEFNVVF